MSILEKQIERNVCRYAKKCGFLVPKLNVVGERGWPDRMFIDPEGWVFFVEFKAPSKPLAPIQLHMCTQLTQRNLVVLTIDSEEEGLKIVDELVAARVSKEGNGAPPESGVSRIISGPGTREN